MTNDFDIVRGTIGTAEWDAMPSALAALARIEAALRVFATVAQEIDAERARLGLKPLADNDHEGWWDEVIRMPNPGDFRAAAARFAETAEGEGR